MVHSLNALLDLAFCIVPMPIASNQKVENIKMKEGDDSSSKPRMPPPSKTSQEDKDTYKEQFKQMKLFIKFTGKNEGGIPDNKKLAWEEANKEVKKEISETPTCNGPFYLMLDMFVENLPCGSMVGLGFEGDNDDCTWTKALKIAFEYLTIEKGFDVHVFAVKAMPGKSLINPEFFSGWRNAVAPSLFNKWHFLIVGDDSVPETKMFKETWTNNVANIIANLMSIRFHWNKEGNKFNAGARLMLEQVGLTATADATMEQTYTDWDTEKTDDMQAFFSHMADKNNVRLETSLNGLFNAVYRI
jgi:hypothetical protein